MTVYNAGQPVDIGGSTVPWNQLETMAPSKGKLWSDLVWYDDARHIVGVQGARLRRRSHRRRGGRRLDPGVDVDPARDPGGMTMSSNGAGNGSISLASLRTVDEAKMVVRHPLRRSPRRSAIPTATS